MFSVALMLLLTAGSSVLSIDLIQPDSKVVQPGQSLTIVCRPSGYSMTAVFATGWIRQSEGKPMEWIFHMWGHNGDFYKNNALKNKFSYSRDTSAGTVTITGQNLQPEDAAVYYCVRWYGDAFDYWGSGTKVTVSSDIAPSLFPVVQCGPVSGDKLTVGCLVHNFNPMSTIEWTDAAGTALATPVKYPPVTGNNTHFGFSAIEIKKSDWDSWKSFKCAVDGQSTQVEKKPSPPKVSLLKEPRGTSQVLFCTVEDFLPKDISVKWKKNGQEVQEVTPKDWDPKLNRGTYSTVSLLEVSNTDWNSGAVYSCEVSHRQNLYIKKASKAVITVNLKQPNPTELFNNKQAKLECVIVGQDKASVQSTRIRWEIDGPNQRNSTTEEIKSEGAIHKKTSTLTQSLSDWLTVEKVRCSAEGEHVSPVTEEIIVQKGDGKYPKVTLHILPDEFIEDKVTLICLVSSSVKQDFYIAWSEYVGKSNKVYTDGITFLPEKHDDHYRVTSLYTTTKKKWESNYMFECNVWPAGRSDKISPTQVSNAGGNALECP